MRYNRPAPSIDSALNVEILEEQASSLGRAGKRVETLLAALNTCKLDDPDRPNLLQETSDAVYHLLIQRELCGLRNQEAAIRAYGIPGEVVVTLGAQVQRRS